MTPLRLGIIGAGPIVEKKHLPALDEVPEIAVVALCRRDAERLHALADRFRVAQRFTDYRDLLDAKDIDAVLIATGPAAQPQIAKAAAAAGKHIFAEKPMAETSDQARDMAEAIRTAQVQFHLGFNKRFYYGYRQAKTCIQAGALGELSGLQARFWFQPGRRDPMLHNGVHFLDLAAFFMGPVSEVFARRYALPQNTAKVVTPETLTISMAFANGAVGNLLLSSLASWDYVNEHIDLIGSNHTVLSVENGRQVQIFQSGEQQPVQRYENTLSVHWWSGNEEQGFTPQLRAFAHRILHATQALTRPDDLQTMTAHAEDGIRSLALFEAVKKSIAQGTNVSLAHDTEP